MKKLSDQISQITPVSANSDTADRKKYYADVELSESELQVLVDAAKQKKFHELERLEYIRKQEEFIENLKQPFTPKELQTFVLEKLRTEIVTDRPPFFNEETKIVFKALCYYFTGDAEFETMGENWKLNKGLCLMGNVGTGKTTLMRMFSRNKRQSYQVLSCRKIAGEYAENGHEILHKYSSVVTNYINDYKYFLQKNLGFCFDDLGTESNKKNYGNTVNVMEEILLNRYDNRQFGWNFTHITTNLTADQIEETYGSRVRSRMREMFNIIELTGGDLRK